MGEEEEGCEANGAWREWVEKVVRAQKRRVVSVGFRKLVPGGGIDKNL